jgi:hypothetical protein
VQIYDPLTGNADGTGRSVFPGEQIPQTRINSAAATITGLLPALTRPTSYTNNYDAYGGTQYNRNSWDYKVNYNPSDKQMIWGRYSFSPMNIVAPFVLGAAEGDVFGGGNPINSGGLVQTTATGFTDTLSPTLLLDANIGYTRQSIGANGDEGVGDYGTQTLKIPGTNGVGTNYQGIPAIPGHWFGQHGQHQYRQPVQVPRQPVHHRHQPDEGQGRPQPALRFRIR